jgi:integrase
MARRIKQAPTLKRHKRSGNGYARFSGRQYWFGPFDDPETHARFAVFKARWETNGRQVPDQGAAAAGLTVADLSALYLEHAETYYRRGDGTQTQEVGIIACTIKPLLALFREQPVGEFSLRCLKLLRERMIDDGLCRKTVNDRVTRVVRIFGWGAEEELVPPEVYGALRALRPLKAGRSRAPESEPVQPVVWEDVEPVLQRVSRQVGAMIQLQWLTGARPGEIVQMRPMDIDRRDGVWEYRPARHKTAHFGKQRVIPLGPKAQGVLEPFLLRVPRPAPARPLFSPSDAEAERRARAREARATPVWPSHERARVRSRRVDPKRRPGEAYTVASYRRAILRGCESAGVRNWTPNQLRHAAATRIRREFGLEAARAVLGHASAATTEIYAEVDQLKASEVAARLG